MLPWPGSLSCGRRLLAHEVPEVVELLDLLEIEAAGEEVAGVVDFADDEVGVDEGAAEESVGALGEGLHGRAEGVLRGLLVGDEP